jgi:hypothetical protein
MWPLILADFPTDLSFDNQTLQCKNSELTDLYRAKNLKHSQMARQYNELRQRDQTEKIMAEAASKDVAQTLRSIDAARGHDGGLRHTTVSEHEDPTANFRLPKRRHDRNDSGQTRMEQLHPPHQRSGSSATGADQVGMPPPRTLPTTRIRSSFSSPCQGDVLADMNHSQSYKFW